MKEFHRCLIAFNLWFYYEQDRLLTSGFEIGGEVLK